MKTREKSSSPPVGNQSKLLPLKELLYSYAEQILKSFEAEGTNRDKELIQRLSSSYFIDEDDPETRKELEGLQSFLWSKDLEEISEINLRIANHNLGNYDETPKARLLADFLNDFLVYFIPRVLEIKDWQPVFDKYYGVFEKEYLAQTYTVDFFARIVNFTCESEKLSNSTRLYGCGSMDFGVGHLVYAEKAADYYRLKGVFERSSPDVQLPFKDYEHFLHVRKEFQKKPKKGREPFSFYETLRKFVLALRCQDSGDVYIDFAVPFFIGNQTVSSADGRKFPENELRKEPMRWMQLKYPRDEWLKRMWAGLEVMDYGLIASVEHKIEDSYRREVRGRRSWNNLPKMVDKLDRLCDLFTALDGMFQTEHGETKQKVALYTARLCQLRDGSAECHSVRAFVEECYDIRSDYQHGRLQDAIRKSGKAEQLEERVNRLDWHVKWVISVFALNQDLRSRLGGISGVGIGNLSGIKTVYDKESE